MRILRGFLSDGALTGAMVEDDEAGDEEQCERICWRRRAACVVVAVCMGRTIEVSRLTDCMWREDEPGAWRVWGVGDKIRADVYG
jgi:hypothetical protein